MRLSGADGIGRQNVQGGATLQRVLNRHAWIEAVEGRLGRYVLQHAAWLYDWGDTDGSVAEAGFDQPRKRQFERGHCKAHNLAIHQVTGPARSQELQ
ncbi:MAG: hypothetical protein NTNFB01_37490 [Nitrospira sp.]